MSANRGYGIGTFWFVTLLLVGCVGLGPGGGVVWRLDDPPGLSPYAQPLNTPPSNSAQQAVTKPDSSLAPAIAGGGSARRRALEAPEPGQPCTNSAGRPPASPTPIVPEPGETELALEIDVAAPESAVVDDPVSLRLTVHNRTPRAADNVTVTVRFNDAWLFPGSERRSLTEELGRIEPDTGRGVTFSLQAREPGMQTVELVVKSDTHAEAARTVSIDVKQSMVDTVQRSAVDVQVVGPAERTAGSRAEYILTLINESGQAQPDTRVTLLYDDSLLLKEVSAGVERSPGKLIWDLGELLQDERVRIQVEFECRSVADRSCLRAEVSGRDFAAQQREVCLQIAPRPDVDLQISDSADPIAVEESTTYAIQVTNGSGKPLRGLTLHLTPTEQFEIVAVQARTAAGEAAIETERGVDGWSVTKREPLAPAGTLTFDVQVHAREIGVGQLIAVLKAEGLATPVMAREMTVVDPPAVRQE